MNPRALTASLVALLLAAPAAHGTEVEFDGAYRARFRVFDTLSLDRELEDSERLAMYMQHRVWLRPRFLLSDKVSLKLDFKGLDNLVWGDQYAVPTTGVGGADPTYQFDVTAPTIDVNSQDEDGTAPLADFTLWRAWGEVHTGIGRFRFGRMPLHWGSGIWLNDGLSVASHFADHGDTADRIEWDYLVIDQFFVRLAMDVNAERFVADVDDTTSFNAALAYRSETVDAGIHTQLQHTVNGGLETGKFNLFTIDLAASATLGKLFAETEFVGQFGGGDVNEELDDVNVTAFGSIVGAELDLDPWGLRIEGGLATGDGTLNDQSLRTFTFDRDYTVGLMLFEQPLPTLAATLGTDANGNRSFDQALTGTAVSNALYLKPTLRRSLVDGFDVHASWLGARVAKVPASFGGRKSYGMEVQLGADYTGIEHVDFGLLLGTFLPGSYYTDLTEDEDYPGFETPAFGGQLSTRIHF